MKKRFNSSGQVMIMAGAMGVIMTLAVMVGYFVSQGALHRAAGAQRTVQRGIAEEGVNFAAQQLSKDYATWQNALHGTFSGTDCNTGNAVQGPSGGSFLIYCSTGIASNPKLQIYQVAVKAVALNISKKPVRAVRAYLSQRTLGTDLATGVHAGAALQTVRQLPTANVPTTYWQNTIDVHWGPIVNFGMMDTEMWTLRDPIDGSRYPRKFSPGGIHGTTYNRSGETWAPELNTDQKEYWAFSSQDIPPTIDEAAYQALASSSDVNVGPTNNIWGGGDPTPRYGCGSAHPNCAVFRPNPGDFAIFDGPDPSTPYTIPSGAVVYVMGPVIFNQIAIDNATFIITGTLAITSGSASGFSANLHVPVTAPSEYPYSPNSWPCHGLEGNTVSGGGPAYDCPSDQVFPTGKINYRGFLWVKENMNVFAYGGEWNMVGSLLVGDSYAPSGSGGRLQVFSGYRFNLAYDDVINHAIRVNPISGTAIRLVIDRSETVPI